MSETFKLIRSRRRTIALIIQADGSLMVRAPLKAPEGLILEFVQSKAGWIRKKQAQANANRVPARQFIDGEPFWYLGKTYPLILIGRERPALRLGESFFLARSAQAKASAVFIRWYKAQAMSVLSERVRWFASRYGFPYPRLRISSARTRWGSCSAKGTLSFTYRLVMAPEAVIDYVVVHELVHLKVRNHSKAFWKQVEAINPDYKRHIAWLKKNGHFLTLGSD